jgi:hypothetical protein
MIQYQGKWMEISKRSVFLRKFLFIFEGIKAKVLQAAELNTIRSKNRDKPLYLVLVVIIYANRVILYFLTSAVDREINW